MTWLFIFCCLANLNFEPPLAPQPQTLTYGIYWGDDEIGSIVASVRPIKNEIQYEVNSNANFRVLWKYKRTTELDVVYSNNVLISSFNQIFLNNKLKESSQVKMENGFYQCFMHPSESFQQKPEIGYSTARLYFEEPIGISKVYSEAYLEFALLEDEGNHSYKLTLPGNKINHYLYENGKLMRIEVNRTWFNLVFKRKSV